ncbi:MAG: Omp28-related outer membrane protein [Dysgonamonadaceae bacterium]|jgi:hypothetical protein|nr:Omp28-related outer membrane protein [Dysgonamonadaceae bacterium]
MKLNLLSFICILLATVRVSTVATAQQHVTIEGQKKNILLEEFTGIHCGNCPDGHKIANNLVSAQSGTVYTIAIHSGHFAIPSAGEPDYRIPEGEAIDTYFGVNTNYGYPSGMINRRQLPSSYILNRSAWTKAAKAVHSEDSPVNLWMSAAFDGSSRQLTVEVEAYYTADSDSAENFLHVAITQTDIKGPQSGGLVGDDYIHRHQLKAYITPVWGDTIKQPKRGELITKQYVYTLPEAVNSIPVAAENIEVFVFVTAGKSDLLNVVAKKPSYINYTKPMKITLSAVKEGYASRYAFNFFDVNVKNESHYKLTSIDFELNINNNVIPVTWTGEIPSYQSQTVRLFADIFPLNESIDEIPFEIKAVRVNNTAISNIASVSGKCRQPVAATPTVLTDITTDVYSDENIFSIKDQEGNIVQTFGPYPTGLKKTYRDTVKLEANKIYCFEITDLWGDGLSGGSYKLRNGDGTLFAQNLNVNLFGDRLFFSTTLPDVSGIEEFTVSETPVSIQYYNLQGVRTGSTIPQQPGIYIVKTIYESGKTSSKKIIIHF